MRLTTVHTISGTRAARLDNDRLTALNAPDVGSLLMNPEWRAIAEATPVRGDLGSLNEALLAPLVPKPPKIVCVGINYADHVAEMNAPTPEPPTLFAKFARALVGPHDPIVIPAAAPDLIDWEAELAIVIGSHGRHLDERGARSAIAGYTAANDVSARDWQFATTQWLSGKTFEHTTPIGPVLVTSDEVDHAADLEIVCEVDGIVKQRSRTSLLIFQPDRLVAHVSSILTLEPGDLILTGTPGGVGFARTPPERLVSGSRVTTRIEGIGELQNVCILEDLTTSTSPDSPASPATNNQEQT
jgi:acylpyruvate hydrolase